VRSYRQYCALARALDLVGDRWTLLIIRELFARDARYSDLRDALPGIATNLLADRLRQLQDAGIVESYDAPPPVRAAVYRLTSRGRELRPVLRALVTWGAPLLETGQGADDFRTQWLVMPLRIVFDGVDVADLAPLTVLVKTGNEPATIDVSREGLWMELGTPASQTDVEVEGKPEKVFEFLTGRANARTDGVIVRGRRDAVRRLRALTTRSPVAGSASPTRATHPVSSGRI
jgi:DNA-binding HxlR family transcriptional regulator